MAEKLKIGVRFNCSEEISSGFWKTLIERVNGVVKSMALIDLSGEDLIFNAISCMQAENREEIYHTAPKINTDKCKFCGKCIDYCKHKAISMQKGSGKIIIEPELCTDCGKCYKGCSKKGAIKKHDYLVGLVEWTDRNENIRVFRVAFRKKWLLKKKGLPVLKKHAKGFKVKIYSLDTNYCGKSVEKDMDFMFDISGKADGEKVLESVLNLVVD